MLNRESKEILIQNILYNICNRYSVTCIDHCVCITMHFFMLHNWKNIWWKDLSFVVSALSENAPETSKKQPWKIASVDFCLFVRIYKIVSFVLNYKERFNSSHILDKNQNSRKMWSESWSESCQEYWSEKQLTFLLQVCYGHFKRILFAWIAKVLFTEQLGEILCSGSF